MPEMFTNGDIHDLIVEVKVQNEQLKEFLRRFDSMEHIIEDHDKKINQIEKKIGAFEVWIGIISSVIIAMLVKFINACF